MRGRGLECKCRSWLGAETHPRAVAKSRTERVSTNEESSENRNSPRQIRVNYRHLDTHAYPQVALFKAVSQLWLVANSEQTDSGFA